MHMYRLATRNRRLWAYSCEIGKLIIKWTASD